MKPKAVSKLVRGHYSEELAKKTATALLTELGRNPTFGLLFATPDYSENIEDLLETVRLNGHVPVLAGCTGQGLIGTAEECEGKSGFSLILFALPDDCQVHPFEFSRAMVEESEGGRYWRDKTGLPPDDVKAWLVLADPFSCPIDQWLKTWNQSYPGVPCLGGLACGPVQTPESWVFLNDHLVDGGLVLGLTGSIRVSTVVSQGCKPIGEPLTVTQASQNILLTVGYKPAFEVLNDVFQSLSEKERQKAKGHLFAGLAMNEYVEEYKQGDFLVRNILDADPASGGVAINAMPRVGQTMQYHLRDASAASDDLKSLLKATKKRPKAFAGFLCNCNGRGRELFNVANHDAKLINEAFPELPLAGFFANGEIGPIGQQNFIHGYTASLALFSAIPTKAKEASKR